MQTLNLITPSKSDISFKKIQFPDGQPHLKIEVSSIAENSVKIITRITSPSDLFMLQLAKSVLDDCAVTHCDLEISYLMAARMDRVMNEGEPLALRVVADSINALNFNHVSIFDPHSDVATALIRRSKAITNVAFVKNAIADYFQNENIDLSTFVLVSPDAGAMKKTYNISQALGGAEVVECAKKRSLKDGSLSGFKVFAENIEQKTCFITDDICDGGGTFAGIAEQLKLHNAGKIILVVSHGIFSKGFEIPNIDLIYSSNSFRDFSETPSHVQIFSNY